MMGTENFFDMQHLFLYSVYEQIIRVYDNGMTAGKNQGMFGMIKDYDVVTGR